MKRFHVHLGVPDLSASIRFYSDLFGKAPTVREGRLREMDARRSTRQLRDLAARACRRPQPPRTASRVGGRTCGHSHAVRSRRCDGYRRRARRALLLCEIGQALGHRSSGHRLGSVPHAGFDSAVRCGHRRSKGRRGLLFTQGEWRFNARQSGQHLRYLLLTSREPRHAGSRLQRAVPLHRQFRAQHHRGSDLAAASARIASAPSAQDRNRRAR